MEKFKIIDLFRHNGIKLISISAAISISLGISSCSIFRPYKIPIQQGQQYSAKTIQQLKPDMTKDQVRYLLGEPNANSPFQNNQWLYIYTNQHNYLPRSESKLILTFNNKNKLANISGDIEPPEKLTYNTVGAK